MDGIETNKIYHGSALDVLKTFEPESIDMVCTSPPYYGLRDYGIEGQIGNEKTPKEYVSNLIQIFGECKRVLKKTGSIWINIGDSYGGTGSKGKYKDPGYVNGRNGQVVSLTTKLKPKCLLGIPERLVIAMTDELNLVRRNTIIWHKGNPFNQPVHDRFYVDFEYFYFFTKSPKKYWFEKQYEPSLNPQKDRIKRCVWKINLQPFRGAHFSVFPERLVETPIKACCPSPNGIVLDCFMGSGTVGVVAKKLRRNYLGIELKEYVDMAEKRINGVIVNEKLVL